MNIFLILSVIFPIVSGALIALFRFNKRRVREVYVLCATLITSLLVVLALVFTDDLTSFYIFSITEKLPIMLRLDGMGRIFAGLLAFLWPLAVSYSLEYMRHEGQENTFYTFYLITYGVTLGIAMSHNLITMYSFYELLTLVTLPIVMHGMREKNIRAGQKYVVYSIGGAAFAFIGIMAAFYYGGTTDFVYGGIFHSSMPSVAVGVIRFVYVLVFLGFGVKAAIFPLHGWLPAASVAPTPVTALLHAVAVVNCGAFAIMRVTYYIFGTEV
ncbi:MAG: proton-conducting membrane transporter, partial [Lachnospiraceae bacterium]|nr:proton-conducting membrane transporter [Lachnospiraceae bacterium]